MYLKRAVNPQRKYNRASMPTKVKMHLPQSTNKTPKSANKSCRTIINSSTSNTLLPPKVIAENHRKEKLKKDHHKEDTTFVPGGEAVAFLSGDFVIWKRIVVVNREDWCFLDNDMSGSFL